METGRQIKQEVMFFFQKLLNHRYRRDVEPVKILQAETIKALSKEEVIRHLFLTDKAYDKWFNMSLFKVFLECFNDLKIMITGAMKYYSGRSGCLKIVNNFEPFDLL